VNDVVLGLSYPYGTLPVSKRSVLFPRFEKVVHVIRHPEKQVSSFTAHSNKSYAFVYSSLKRILSSNMSSVSIISSDLASESLLPLLDSAHSNQSTCYRGEKCHLEFALLSWIYWNRHVER
jgi:hypothetical protein